MSMALMEAFINWSDAAHHCTLMAQGAEQRSQQQQQQAQEQRHWPPERKKPDDTEGGDCD
jgi:hypothetical protein